MIPKKKKGFRKIIVDNKSYNWRFSELIEIRPEQYQSNKLEIDFGYSDPWLNIEKPIDFEPKIITPTFIKKAIENAIILGWNIEALNSLKKLKYTDGSFKNVESKNTPNSN